MYPFLESDEYDVILQQFKLEIVGMCTKCGGTGHSTGAELDEETLAPEISLCECAGLWNFRLDQIKAAIPKEFWSVEDLDMDNNDQCSIMISRYIKNLSNARKKGLGFLMMGENGVGKTTLATLVLSKAIRAGWSAFYITAHDMVDIIFKSFKNERLGKLLDSKLDSDFVVIDEIDKTHIKGDNSYVLTKVDSILRRRRAIVKPTTLITNMTEAELNRMLGASIMSIVSSSMKQLRFRPGDFRKKQGATWDQMLEG